MSFFENTRKPEGFGGKIMVAMMNLGHSPVARWGLHFLELTLDAKVLDYIHEGQIEAFEGFEDFDLIAFDWYDVRSERTAASQMLLYLDREDLFLFCEDQRSYDRLHGLLPEGLDNQRALYRFFVELLHNDMDLLEDYETEITETEDAALRSSRRDYLDKIAEYRRELLRRKRYYEQLDAIFTDIYPDAVKIGMVSSAELIDTIAEKLHAYEAKHIVVDPVMVATSGSKLLRDDAVQALTAKLLPMAEVLTPNIPEAEILSGMTISDAAGMEAAAKAISEKYGCAVLCKGGHQINDADDLLWRSGTGKWFHGKRIANPNTHGTGCTLSSAIASNLAKGCDLDTSVERAKAYISGCLSAMLDLGHGSGPMDHMFALKGEFVDG
mgnify:CR=1 FL=1